MSSARARGVLALSAAACAVLALSAARAERVPIGRYAELPIGRASGHAYAASGGDGRRTGQSRFAAPPQTPVRQWSALLPERALTPPAVRADGTLLLGTSGGVVALDPSGKRAWTAASGAVRFTPALAPSGEAVVVAGGELRVIDPLGASRAIALGDRARGLPLLLDAAEIVVGARDGLAHAVGLDGAYLASVPLADRAPRFTTFLGHGLLAIAGESAALTLLSAQGGSERNVRLPSALTSVPIATPERTLLAVTERGSLIEIDAAGTVTTWLELGAGVLAPGPALGRDRGLRVGLRHGEITCLDPGGAERWRRGIDGQPGAIALDRDDTALVVSSRGTLYAIDAAGELRWRASSDLIGASRPVLGGDGVIYLVGRGGRVEAWR